MSRPLRILYANAWYHVMNRGAARTAVFHDCNDYQMFLNLLLNVHRRYCFEIHAYCLMPNHYHILIRTPLPNLSRGMRYINGLYTQYYNKKYKKDGALFRGRYKAILVDAENYLLRLSRYIHLNPLKAELVSHPEKYQWSSYRFYSSNILLPDWLYIKKILSCFEGKQQKNQYCFFVMEKTDHELENFYRKTKLLPILGADVFRQQISDKYLSKGEQSKEISNYTNVCVLPSLPKICNVVATYYQISIQTLFKVDRLNGNQPRTIAIYLAAEFSGKKFKDIANYFKDISESGITQIVWRINKGKSIQPLMASDITKLSKLL